MFHQFTLLVQNLVHSIHNAVGLCLLSACTSAHNGFSRQDVHAFYNNVPELVQSIDIDGLFGHK